MTSGNDQLAELRRVIFSAVDDWNAAHPHPLMSHRERAVIHVTSVYADATELPSFALKVLCPLSGSAQLTFHGPDLAAVVEHARLTLEHRIAAEIQRRIDKAHEPFDDDFGVAV